MPQHSTSPRSIFILPSHLRLCHPSGLLPSSFPTKTLCAPLLYPYVLHALPISVFLISSPEYSVRRTKRKVPCYVVFSTRLLPRPWSCIQYNIFRTCESVSDRRVCTQRPCSLLKSHAARLRCYGPPVATVPTMTISDRGWDQIVHPVGEPWSLFERDDKTKKSPTATGIKPQFANRLMTQLLRLLSNCCW